MDNIETNIFGELLHWYRVQRHITQSDLAQLTKVSRQTISGWEKNYYLPNVESMRRLAQVLQLSESETDALFQAVRPASEYHNQTAIQQLISILDTSLHIKIIQDP